MPVLADKGKARFRLAGADFEPTDAAWKRAGPVQRRAYWGRIAELAQAAKREELARGTGIDGRRLRKVKRPRADGASGPPLTPHAEASRFRKWLRKTATAAQATLWWSHGWARVVSAHARGAGRLPVRDVVGLTRKSQREIARTARAEWKAAHA